MAPLTSSPTRASAPTRPWADRNAHGLACAAASDWSGAAAAFADAVALLSREPETAASDALALVLSNLAHACARDGRAPEAMRHARRALALRESLVGQASPVVARTRMDLAVLLASSGQLAAARAMLDEAMLRLEERFGPHDPRLVDPLENSSRLSLLSGDSDRAVDDWHRLHGIVERHQLPTTRLEALAGRLVAGGADPRALRGAIADAPAAEMGLADAELADAELADAELADADLAETALATDGFADAAFPEVTEAAASPLDQGALDSEPLLPALEDEDEAEAEAEASYAPTPLEVLMQETQLAESIVPPTSGFELDAVHWGVEDDLMIPWGALDGGALVFDAEVVAQPGTPATGALGGDAETMEHPTAPEGSATAPDGADAIEAPAMAGTEGADAEGAYAEGAYDEGEHADDAYAEGAYAEGEHAEGAYAEGAYAEGEHAEDGDAAPRGAEAEASLTDVGAPLGWGAPPTAAGRWAGARPVASDDVEVPWADEERAPQPAAAPGALLREPSPEIPDFLFPAASEAPLPPEVARFAPPDPVRGAARGDTPVEAPAPGGSPRAPGAPVFTTHHGEERLERLAPELVEEAEWGRTGGATPHDGSVAVHQSPMTKYEEIVRRASRQPSLNQGRRRRAPMTTGRVVLLSAITVAVVGVGGASWWLLLH